MSRSVQRSYRSRRRPAWRTPLIIGVVALAAVGVGLIVGMLLDQPSGTAEQPSGASGSAVSSASLPASPSAEASQAPSASEVAAGPTPVVEAPAGILPPGSVGRVTVDALRMREEPTTTAPIVATVGLDGLVGLGFGFGGSWGPVEAEGYEWYPAAVLTITDLESATGLPSGWVSQTGWVAARDETDAFVELLAPRCVEGEPELATLEGLAPWERLACYGNRTLTLEGVYGCGGCGGVFPGIFEPGWLAYPLEFDLLSIEPQDRIGPIGLHFPPDGAAPPEAGSIIRVMGHFDDPAATECQVSPGEPPTAVDQLSAELYCRERFVVEDYEVLGTDEDFPTS